MINFARLPPSITRGSQIIELLGNEIRRGGYQPGDRLPTEHALIERFGVSRTVIREAIASLKAEGLVVTRQGSGAFVSENPLGQPFRIAQEEMNTLPQILHVLQLRLAAEVEAAGVAAENREARALDRMGRSLDMMDDAIRNGTSVSGPDFDFHLAIAAATGNPFFERFMRFLRNTLAPGRELSPELKDPDKRRTYFTYVQGQHRAIYAAIRDGNPEEARYAARAHVHGALEEYRKMDDRETTSINIAQTNSP
jgi:GntR family transcriptional repressor for pyruvate dehydrogenase complex